MNAYAIALAEAMDMLAADQRTIFLGQAVRYPGTSMSGTLFSVPDSRKIEMPVCEETQLGMSIGLALDGFVPVSLFPRWNFLILAANQLVNHLDRLPLISDYRPKVIIRVGIGSRIPLDPGPQHDSNFSQAFQSMCETVDIIELRKAEEVMPAYRNAMERDGSTILVEVSDLYNP